MKNILISYIDYFNVDKRVIYHLKNSDSLFFSERAECQMEWHLVDREKILDVLIDGKVNFEKSKKDQEPCQLYVIEKKIRGDFFSVRFEYCYKSNTVKVISFIINKEKTECN